MADKEKRVLRFFVLLLEAGILVTGMVRSLVVKRRRPAEALPGPSFERAVGLEVEKDIARASSKRAPKTEQERGTAVHKLPAHFTIRLHWHEPKPASVPALTYAPATMALGIVIFALGLITRWYVAAMGGLIFARAIWIWVGDLTDERSDRNIDGV